ncbi:MAG TPA: hypothetical protein VJA21_03135 [Verrucomicrobiae bacterium]
MKKLLLLCVLLVLAGCGKRQAGADTAKGESSGEAQVRNEVTKSCEGVTGYRRVKEMQVCFFNKERGTADADVEFINAQGGVEVKHLCFDLYFLDGKWCAIQRVIPSQVTTEMLRKKADLPPLERNPQ